jgi:hypothetical protein
VGERVWTGRSRLLVGVGAALLALLTWRFLEAGTRGAEVASVLGFTLAVGTVLAGIVLRPHDLGDAALARRARRLASQVHEERAMSRRQLLADTGAPQPADIAFHRSEGEGLLAGTLVRWRADGGAATGPWPTSRVTSDH